MPNEVSRVVPTAFSNGVQKLGHPVRLSNLAVEVATHAREVAAPFLVKDRARERTLGRALAQHRELIGRQELVPLDISADDLKSLGRLRRCRPEPSGRCHQTHGAAN
jgi:hypothetical protein